MERNWVVTVWGVRGAVPRAEADFKEYGGNTSCICADCGGELVVFDAGSGIVRLGEALARQDRPKRVHILISHMHLDHILGLPGFSLLHDRKAEIHLYGEAREGVSFRSQLERFLGPPYWPLGLKDFRAGIAVHEIGPDERFSPVDGLTVSTLRGNHPNQSLLYRLDGMGKSVVYALDCEMNPSMESRLARFAQNCSLLIWDANFIQADLKPGWGHSTWEQGAALREAANAKMALMIHFSHTYTDQFLQEQERLARNRDTALCFAKEGMDQRAVDEIGPYQQWGRDVIAMAIEALNESEDCRPAAIALDILYVGETDPEADEWLAEAAGAYGNVITACAAQFDATFVEYAPGKFYRERFAVLGFEEPYGALREATGQGHINAMLDTDGILRHHMLYITLPDGTQVPSLALAAAEKYRAFHGLAPVDPPPTDGNGFWYVPFTGIPGDFDGGISVADLLEGNIPAEEFAGKIVLIGPYTTGLQDSYVTSADHTRPMYGVEYQANAIQAMLWGEPKREVSDAPQLAVLFALLLAAFAGFWRRRVRLSTALWVILCAGWPLLCRVLYNRGLVLRLMWVPIGVTVLYVGCIAYNYIQSALEKRRVTNTFKRYVAPEIVNELLKEGPEALELGGRLTNIAVLFVDVRGFTTMSEQLQPGQVVEILNRYLRLISDCILRNRGTLDKFVGDAVVGNIGSPQRMDYTAIGDTVNTAARLEANAPGGTIYISRAVADRLEGRIKVTSLGESIKLKGKAEGFEVLILDEIL